jgi:hypothetical protein
VRFDARIEYRVQDYECRQKQSCGELLRRAGPTWPGILLHVEGEAVCKGDYPGDLINYRSTRSTRSASEAASSLDGWFSLIGRHWGRARGQGQEGKRRCSFGLALGSGSGSGSRLALVWRY